MRILITGGLGFIGAGLAKRLAKRHNVIVFDFRAPEKFEKIKKVKYVKGNVERKKDLLKASKGCGCIVHLASPTSPFESNNNPKKYSKFK